MHKLLFVSEFEREVPGTLEAARVNVQKTASSATPVLEPMHELLLSLVPKPLVGAFEDVSEPAVKVERVPDVIGGPYWGARTAPRTTRVLKDAKITESDWLDKGANRRSAQKEPVSGRVFKEEDGAGKRSAFVPSRRAASQAITPSSESFGPVQESSSSPERCEPPYMASVFGEDIDTDNVLSFLTSGYVPPQKPETAIFTPSLVLGGGGSSGPIRKTPELKRLLTSSPRRTESFPTSTGWTIWDRPPSIENTMTPPEEPKNITWIFIVMVVVGVVLMVTMYVSYVVNMTRLEKARATAMSKPTFPTEEMW